MRVRSPPFRLGLASSCTSNTIAEAETPPFRAFANPCPHIRRLHSRSRLPQAREESADHLLLQGGSQGSDRRRLGQASGLQVVSWLLVDAMVPQTSQAGCGKEMAGSIEPIGEPRDLRAFSELVDPLRQLF